MNKKEFIDRTSAELKVTKVEATRIFNVYARVILEGIKNDAHFVAFGKELGVFKVKERKARKYRNPINGTSIDAPAKKFITFRTSKHAHL